MVRISPFKDRNRLEDTCATFGGEVSTGYIYRSPCIAIHVYLTTYIPIAGRTSQIVV